MAFHDFSRISMTMGTLYIYSPFRLLLWLCDTKLNCHWSALLSQLSIGLLLFLLANSYLSYHQWIPPLPYQWLTYLSVTLCSLSMTDIPVSNPLLLHHQCPLPLEPHTAPFILNLPARTYLLLTSSQRMLQYFSNPRGIRYTTYLWRFWELAFPAHGCGISGVNVAIFSSSCIYPN